MAKSKFINDVLTECKTNYHPTSYAFGRGDENGDVINLIKKTGAFIAAVYSTSLNYMFEDPTNKAPPGNSASTLNENIFKEYTSKKQPTQKK